MEQVTLSSGELASSLARDQDDDYYKSDEFRMSSMKVSWGFEHDCCNAMHCDSMHLIRANATYYRPWNACIGVGNGFGAAATSYESAPSFSINLDTQLPRSAIANILTLGDTLQVVPCAKRFVHDWTECPFAHPQEKARRRDPKVHSYTGIACPSMKKVSPSNPRL